MPVSCAVLDLALCGLHVDTERQRPHGNFWLAELVVWPEGPRLLGEREPSSAASLWTHPAGTASARATAGKHVPLPARAFERSRI